MSEGNVESKDGGSKEVKITPKEGDISRSSLLKKHGFKNEEVMEIEDMYWLKTGYPEPFKRYRWVMEGYNVSIEESYFHVLDYMREEYGFPEVDKLTDVFTAAENSAFFGVSQQRLGLQQDKISQFLATIGKMVKELFQLVRELRIIDERLAFYNDSYNPKSKSRESAEISLKGMWIDLVEQGSKNPASVYGMARELGFATLPDLFFSVHPEKREDIDEIVNNLEFNNKVKEVLKRKLRTYMEWKEATYKELKAKRIFTLKYLRQHYDIIKMYMNWCKPYLRNIKRLQMNMAKFNEPDIISAFENSMIEVELLLKHQMQHEEHKVNYYAIILANFEFRTRPQMSYVQEGYNRGPLHVGRIEICLRGYLWTKKEIDAYKNLIKDEEMELLSSVDESVKAAMEALGGELEKYLKEAGEEFGPKKEEKHQQPKQNFFEPFMALFGLMNKKEEHKEHHHEHVHEADNHVKGLAKDHLKMSMWETYKNYKKTHQMLAW